MRKTSNDYFIGYRCSLCNTEYAPDEINYTCPKDGGNLNVILDFAALRQDLLPEDILSHDEQSIWRYLPLLPVADPGEVGTPLRAVGWTPTFSPTPLAERLGLRNLWVKDESRNPTASNKDRASAIVVARAREIGAEVVVTASTGNAGAALAGMAAAVRHQAVIFAPHTTPLAKIAQLLIYGAQVILVDGNYDQAFDLSIQASDEFGWYCRNTGYNPFTIEGKKTTAYEIWEQLNQLPVTSYQLSVFVSVGDGNIISGLHKGFRELQTLGWMERMPRIFGVQAEGSAAVAQAFFAQTETITPVSANTLADSIAVDLPRDGLRAVRAAIQTNGAFITVSDDQILASISKLGEAGIFAEPAGATSYAGLVKAVEQGQITPDDSVLVINTGSGLKDVDAAMKAASEPPIIEPTLGGLKRELKL